MERTLDQLTQGLAGLDISQIPATSTPVGGARPKVRLSPEVTGEGEVKVESRAAKPEQSQSADSTLPQVSGHKK